MNPTLGRIVHVKGLASNGSTLQAAIVTRVWGMYGNVLVVNLMILPDAAAPYPRTDVPFFQTNEAAEASGHPVCCYWPDKV